MDKLSDEKMLELTDHYDVFLEILLGWGDQGANNKYYLEWQNQREDPIGPHRAALFNKFLLQETNFYG